MRQQQPRIIAPPHGDQLAAKEHRLFHPFQRPLGQHRLGMTPRQHQRRAPPLRKQPVAPPREVKAGTRNPHPPGRHPHVAVPRQFIQKPRLARRGQNRIAGPRKPAAKPLPDQKPLTRRKPLPVGEGLGWGNGAKIPRIPARVQPPLPNPPLKGREQPPVRAERSRDTCSPCARIGGIPRQPDIPRHRHPPAPEPLPALRLIGVVHDPSPWCEANRPSCRFWGSRKMDQPVEPHRDLSNQLIRARTDLNTSQFVLIGASRICLASARRSFCANQTVGPARPDLSINPSRSRIRKMSWTYDLAR